MDLKDSLGLIPFSVIMYCSDRSLKLKSNVVSQRYIRKMSKIRNQTNLVSGENPAIFILPSSSQVFIIPTHNGRRKSLIFSFG